MSPSFILRPGCIPFRTGNGFRQDLANVPVTDLTLEENQVVDRSHPVFLIGSDLSFSRHPASSGFFISRTFDEGGREDFRNPNISAQLDIDRTGNDQDSVFTDYPGLSLIRNRSINFNFSFPGRDILIPFQFCNSLCSMKTSRSAGYFKFCT